MEYELIRPPFDVNFPALKLTEARAYFDWFVDQILRRIEVLERAVRSSPGFEQWRADGSRSSLSALGIWFYEQVETRVRSNLEKQQIYESGPAWFRQVEIPDWDLTDKCFSIAFDVGMYLCQMLRQQYPSLKLIIASGSKRDIDYRQPVLSGFKGGVVFNPVQIMITLAYAFADKRQNPDRLGELCDFWGGYVIHS